MSRRFGSRYAVVVSTLALIVALSGTAYAVNTVRSRDIVNGTIQSVDVRDGGLSRNDLASSSLGRSPRLWAAVDIGGALVNGRGVTTTLRPQTGLYEVTFNRSVAACAIAVTPVFELTGTDAYASFTVAGATVSVSTAKQSDRTPNNNGIHVLAVC